jgi:hypothetical protein
MHSLHTTAPSARPATSSGRSRCGGTRTALVVTATPVLVLGLAVLGGFGAFGAFQPEGTLLAAQSGGQPAADRDGDGLPDELELGLGASPDLVDTDADSFSDAEEFVRGSAYSKHWLTPAAFGDQEIQLGAYLRNDVLHVCVGIYLEDGVLHDKNFTFGSTLAGKSKTHSFLDFIRNGQVAVLPASTSSGVIVLVDNVVSSRPLLRFGSQSFFATLAKGGKVLASSALNLVASKGYITEVAVVTRAVPPPTTAPPTSFSSTNTMASSYADILYKPLGGQGPPDGWNAGQICLQTIEVVGAVGALITQEIVDADCVGGFDGFCDTTNCIGSIGDTLDLIDPGVLIGG